MCHSWKIQLFQLCLLSLYCGAILRCYKPNLESGLATQQFWTRSFLAKINTAITEVKILCRKLGASGTTLKKRAKMSDSQERRPSWSPAWPTYNSPPMRSPRAEAECCDQKHGELKLNFLPSCNINVFLYILYKIWILCVYIMLICANLCTHCMNTDLFFLECLWLELLDVLNIQKICLWVVSGWLSPIAAFLCLTWLQNSLNLKDLLLSWMGIQRSDAAKHLFRCMTYVALSKHIAMGCETFQEMSQSARAEPLYDATLCGLTQNKAWKCHFRNGVAGQFNLNSKIDLKSFFAAHAISGWSHHITSIKPDIHHVAPGAREQIPFVPLSFLRSRSLSRLSCVHPEFYFWRLHEIHAK